MSGSLRRRLLVTILVVVGPLVAGLAGALYFAVQRTVWARFDAELVELGDTVADLVEYDHEDGYEFELGARPRPLTRGPGHLTHFELRGPRGELLSRSDGLDEPLPRRAGELEDFELAGRSHRVAVRRFAPRVDGEAPAHVTPPDDVTLILARETTATEAMLARIAGWFVALGFVTLGLASFAAWWVVRRGLDPLARVAASIEQIGVDGSRELSRRLEVRGLPSELRPTVAHVNALLDRLEQAFARERQFTADVAHELRTPLSVLRTELELSLRRERSVAEYRESQTDALAVVHQLSTMVNNLLLLARLENTAAPALARVDLRELVEEAWATQAKVAHERGLGFACELVDAEIESDRELLRVVIGNLLTNAAEYTEPGGWIRVENDPSTGVLLAVVDSGPAIPAEYHERLFERFWRADQARADTGVHCGIGLSLARSSCERLGYELRVETRGSACAFVISLRRPTPAEAHRKTQGRGRSVPG